MDTTQAHLFCIGIVISLAPGSLLPPGDVGWRCLCVVYENVTCGDPCRHEVDEGHEDGDAVRDPATLVVQNLANFKHVRAGQHGAAQEMSG